MPLQMSRGNSSDYPLLFRLETLHLRDLLLRLMRCAIDNTLILGIGGCSLCPSGSNGIVLSSVEFILACESS